MRNGITHLYLGGILDTRDDVAHLSGTQFLARNHIHLEHTDFIGIIFHAGVKELHLVALADYAVFNLEIGDDSTEGIEHRVEDECLQWRLVVALRSWHTVYHRLQYILNALAGLTGSAEDILMLASDEVNDFVFHFLRHSRRHIYLVDHWNDFQVVLNSHIEVRDGLRLDTLSGIHDQERSLAGCDGTGNLVREVYVSRSIDEVEDVSLSILCLVLHLDGVALDGDTTFPLQVHVVKHLSLSNLDGLSLLQQTVCQGTFTMVDMCNNAEISYFIYILHIIFLSLECKDSIFFRIFAQNIENNRDF